jgi:hypothetical protein
MAVFWDVVPCSLVLILTDVSEELLITLMMEADSTSETSVNVDQTARCYILEDSHLHTRHRENLKSHLQGSVFS